MRKSHKVLTWVIVIAYVALWILVPRLFAFGQLESGLWHVFMGIITLSTVVSCIHFLQPERKIVSIFLGDVYKVSARDRGHQGILNTGIVWVFPPFLNRALYIPATVFTVPFGSSSANTKEDKATEQAITPVTVFIHLQIRFSSDVEGIRAFLEAIPVMEKYRPDLTTPHKLPFHDGVSPDGTPIPKEKDCPCIAALLLEQLQSPVNEAVGRAIPQFTLAQTLNDLPLIEQKIRESFTTTVFQEAELLNASGAPGLAVILFDFNVAAIVPTDPAAAKSLSAETQARYEAKGKIATAEGQKQVRMLEGAGEAAYLKSVAAEATTPEGQLALAATTLQKLPANTNLFAGTDVLTAAAAKMAAQKPTTP